MTELLTAAQMRAIEQAAIESGEVTGLELMERAGRGVVEAILGEWPEMALTTQKAVVLCGPGNNGGDGFVVARLLKERGWEVEVYLYGDVEKLPPDAKVNAERWLEMGEVESITSLPSLNSYDALKTIVIDAIFGTGIARKIDGPVAQKLSGMNALSLGARPRILSIDLPSGVCSDSGTIFGESLCSELTVSFHLAKRGSHLGEGGLRSSSLIVKPIGLAQKWPHPIDGVTLPHDVLISSMLPKEYFRREPRFHKYHYGHALILSGPSARTGAARLAARGALRIGAGLVSVGCPQEAVAECASQLTAIMLSPVEDAAALENVLHDERINALCLGPALGLDDRAIGLVAAALGVDEHRAAPEPRGGEKRPPVGAGRALPGAAGQRKLVLDADALTLLSQYPELFQALHKNCVLTPHAGEFKRLFPEIMAKLEAPATTGPAYSKVDATREAAARAGCTVLFKGADTVIADQTGRAAINSAHYERSAPWLATAGSGDVLAGFIAGLLARGFAPMQAAETAAWLHVECALKFGPGLIAEDIPEQLPAVFRDLKL